MGSPNDWVIVKSFSFPHEAQLARSALEAAGIEADIRDENVVRMDWFYSNAVGGVKVLVPPANLEHALEILDSPTTPTDGPMPADSETCPRCGIVARSIPIVFGKRWAILVWLTTSLPVWPLLRRCRCDACGHVWKPRPSGTEIATN